MLLNCRDKKIRAKAKKLFEEDCKKIAKGERPSRAIETDIYITRRCNMTCSYCYLKEYFDKDYPFKDPSIEELCHLIDKIAGKTYGLVILGGEPLVRKDLVDLVKYAKEKEIPSIRISSNGTYIKRAKAALPYIDRINISLDAARKREFPELISKMLHDLEEVRSEMGDQFPAICISYTLVENESFEKDILPVVQYAAKNNFEIKFLPCKYPNKDVNWAGLNVVLQQARDHIEPRKILNIPELAEKVSSEFLFKNCLQGMQWYIDFEGYFLYPCDEYSNQRVGKIYDHSIDELYAMGQKKEGVFPKGHQKTCAFCKSYCHAENSFIYHYPERQLSYFSDDSPI